MTSLLEFPHPVNEKAARVVAGVVALTSALALFTGWHWLLLPLAYGFLARALSGPRFSPLGLFATRVAAPRLGSAKPVAGPPKRFAQAIGAILTLVGSVAVLVDARELSTGVLVIMAVFATLESVFGICVGCKVFTLLMRLGVVPERTCAACNDLALRRAEVSAPSAEEPKRRPCADSSPAAYLLDRACSVLRATPTRAANLGHRLALRSRTKRHASGGVSARSTSSA
jgi:Domain of unknown function (DUF4395)